MATKNTTTKQAVADKQNGPSLESLGLKSPIEIFDILSILRVDNEPLIKSSQALLDQKLKAQTIMEYFKTKFNISPGDLPYLASMIKHDLKHGKIKLRRN
ncbi:hypothetical protein COT42_07150 [Candidatus Saganbacteria bacterium CG08_land_8_20_14_0_20_45_16]|uniref:Uncharacterized protein n=1 Tax=Candidatus Saganbacteria bacterium CG08_land_8_20_14_0_20_45_16 TaxID=2014293 RepID=A0A2H0XUW0_UNCSA|nr:MAG: hypothetical protein COT42_07150 [Candidatus Saganbacteria bacterium CG08_land_8_20_14_0_20_45_16]